MRHESFRSDPSRVAAHFRRRSVDALEIRYYRTAEFGHPRASTCSVEEVSADFRLQTLDRLRQRRLRNAAPFGRA
jgi:hypothetical protein